VPTSLAKSCGRRGHRNTAAAVDANAAARYTSQTLRRCPAAYVLKYRCLIKRRILLQDAHEVENGRVLMAELSRQTVIPSLAGIVRPLRPVDCGVVDVNLDIETESTT